MSPARGQSRKPRSSNAYTDWVLECGHVENDYGYVSKLGEPNSKMQYCFKCHDWQLMKREATAKDKMNE